MELYYLCSQNIGPDQLCSHCTADLRLFLHGQKSVFLMTRLLSLRLIVDFQLEVSVLESKNFEIFPTKEDGTSFCICADQSKSVKFNVNPKTLGSINVTVTVSNRRLFNTLHGKNSNLNFLPDLTQTSLHSHRNRLGA